jgi:hypothetical protein
MSSNTISIKPANHRVYQCPNEKKLELLNKLIQESNSKDILVVCSKDLQTLQENIANKNIKIIEDRDLVKQKELRCHTLISYDLPIKAIVYMARVSRASDAAYMLLDESEQKDLYQTEMLLGRAIKQEKLEGFEYPVVEKKEPSYKGKKPLTKEQIKEEAKKRYEEKTQDPKPKKEFKKDFNKSDTPEQWQKKKKAPNKFLGKDESGKAMFSGKSGERNHRYDGTPKDKYSTPSKVGRKISIKSRKAKEQE